MRKSPTPDAKFKERIKIKAYPIEEKAGMLWAYMGPGEPPLVPDYDRFYDKGYKQVVYTTIPCNWFQCQENSIDPVHVEWLHGRWSRVLGVGRRGPEPQAHAKVGLRRVRARHHLPARLRGRHRRGRAMDRRPGLPVPNALYVGHFEWRVPIDDENTLSVAWFNVPVPGDAPFEQERIPYWTSPLTDEETGRWIDTHVMNQDFIAWVGQGALADRTQEHLGGSDSGIIMMRRRMLEEARVVADGGEPKCVYRDPENDKMLYLPRQGRAREEQGLPPAFRSPDPNKAPRNVHLARQPQSILDEMDNIWEERGGSTVSSIGTAIE